MDSPISLVVKVLIDRTIDAILFVGRMWASAPTVLFVGGDAHIAPSRFSVSITYQKERKADFSKIN